MRADRLLSILMLLQARGRLTAGELAQELEVSERTIYRDLDALSAAGVPVYAQRGPGGGCALLDSYRTTLTGMTEDEARALFMLSIPSPLTELGVGQELKAALLKLSASLPAAQRQDVQRVRQRIYLDASPWFQPEEPVPHLPTLQEGVWRDRKLQVTYRRSDGSHSQRLIEPYGLVAKTSIWYLVRAFEGRLAVYRVSRIQEASLTKEPFERPADFDLAAYWDQWCAAFESSLSHYDVTLRVAPEFIPVLPTIYGDGVHAKIEAAGPPDEQGWLTLPFTFESLPIARGRVLAMGTMVEVVEPLELRQSVADCARRVADFYQTG